MEAKILWKPAAERVAAARITAFARSLESSGISPGDYHALHRWSVENLERFWGAVWDFSQVIRSREPERVMGDERMPGTVWFEGARLNYAENLLRGDAGRLALIFEAEDEDARRAYTLAGLRDAVARAAAGLRRLGIEPGDRVAALVPNIPETVIAMLACASIGAVWSSCSPDFGVGGVLDRFGQIAPRVLFTADGYVYGGKRYALEERVRAVREELPSIETIVVIPYRGPAFGGVRGQLAWDELLADRAELRFADLPFDHPLYILYTSGTTGVPKCIVHGAGGVLLKHLEEHTLQVDVQRGDRLFYFTTCGWMMWNWLVSGLAAEAAIVLYDGNPTAPETGRLFRMVDRDEVTVFGTSPRYLSVVEKSGLVPRRDFSLASLRAVLSTGSPLHPAQFDWVYGSVKTDVHLASISGGTDIVGCFVLGAPILPVYRGEIQCRALGMDVEAFDDAGKPVVGRKGELVCRRPFPSMPLGFWNDPDGSRYRKAYFERYPGVWHHGDFIEFTERGTAVIYGRSDATLNPGGVRIGTAEIYRQVEALPEVRDAIAVGREKGDEEYIALFVVLAEGLDLDDALREKIRAAIRRGASPRHVPGEIEAIAEVPRTISGKPVEIAVAELLRGEEVANRDALANPDALDALARFR